MSNDNDDGKREEAVEAAGAPPPETPEEEVWQAGDEGAAEEPSYVLEDDPADDNRDEDVEQTDYTQLTPLSAVVQQLNERSNVVAKEIADTLFEAMRLPPQALDAERGMLGGLVIEPLAWEEVSDLKIVPEHFYRPSHGMIFGAMLEMKEQNIPIDTITLVDFLRTKGMLDAVGGTNAIAQLEALLPTAAHVPAYARLVRETATLRALIATGTKIVQAAYERQMSSAEIRDMAEREIMAVHDADPRGGLVTMKQAVDEAIKQLEAAYHAKKSVTGVESGFTDIDELTSGFQPGDLDIIAARPSMGKTAWCLNVTTHVGIRLQLPVLFFSLEMGYEQLTARMIGSEARIDLSDLKRGFLKQTDWSKLAEASAKLSESPIMIYDKSGVTVMEIRAAARRMMAKTGKIGLIIIDYLQLIKASGKYTNNKVAEIGEISFGLKGLARELKVPVIALSQLNRGVESRPDKRPMMSDLRESGAIEQDADLIGFLFREEYYLRDKTPDDKIGIAEFIIAKHRNGPTGTVDLRFFNTITRFESMERGYKREEYAP